MFHHIDINWDHFHDIINKISVKILDKKWLGLVNSCACYARQTSEIYLVLPYSVDFKAPGELWNPLSKTTLYTSFHSHQWIQTGVTVRKRPFLLKTRLRKCSFIWNEGLVNMRITVKFKSNRYIGPVDISRIFTMIIKQSVRPYHNTLVNIQYYLPQ